MAADKVGVEWKSGMVQPMPMDAVRPRHETQSDHLAPTPNLLRGKQGGKGGGQSVREESLMS